MDNIFYTDNQYPFGGLTPINIPGVVRGISRKLRDRMYRTIRPEAYTAENALNFLKREPRVYRDPNSEALLGKYTAQDSIIADSSQAPNGLVGGRSLTPAEHEAIGDSIMLGGAENLRKYAVNDLIIPSKSKQGAYEFAYPNQSGNNPHLPVNYEDIPQSRWTHSKQLGSYYQSKGQDENGNYITYEDTWDINPWRGKSSSDDPTSAWQTAIKIGRDIGLDKVGDIVPFGRPFEIYGKQYYDDKGKPIKKKAEGGSLKETSAWDNLSLAEKAEMIGIAVKNGITTLPEIRVKYNEFAEGGREEVVVEDSTNPYSVGSLVDALYQNNPREEFLGEPKHHYDFTQSEEWADSHGYYPDARGHRDDRVKKPAHPSHPSRGIWNGDKFILTDLGMQNPNYTLFGLNDGGQDPQVILTYDNSIVLPEVTVTPKENFFYNSYDNIELHYAKGGGIHIKPSHRGRLTELKKRTGKTEAELYNDGNPAHKKMVVFARNSRKWKHGLGGNLFDGGGDIIYSHPYYSYDENGQLVRDENENPIINYNAVLPEIVVTPSRQPLRMDGLVKGANTNSNPTVGIAAREIGEAAIRENNRRNAEAVERFNSQNEMHSLFPIGEVSGETVYKGVTHPKVIGVSGVDPIGEMLVAGEALSPLFKLMPSVGIGAKSIQKVTSKGTPWTAEEAMEASGYAKEFFKKDVLSRLQASRKESDNVLFTQNSPFLGRFALKNKPANILGETSPIIQESKGIPYTVELNKSDLSPFDDKLNTIIHEMREDMTFFHKGYYDEDLQKFFKISREIDEARKKGDWGKVISLNLKHAKELRQAENAYYSSFLTPEEKNIIENAYKTSYKSSIKGSKRLNEKVAENTRFRSQVSRMNNNVVGKDLDNVIDKMSEDEVLDVLSSGNSYGLDYRKYIEEHPKQRTQMIKNIKEAWKAVGAFAGASTLPDMLIDGDSILEL